MTLWDFPPYLFALILFAVVSAVVYVSVRLANTGESPTVATFVCAVCGRNQYFSAAKEWRYCPYCGVPKGSRSLADLPAKNPRSFDD